MTSADSATQFIVGVVPADLSAQLAGLDLANITSKTQVDKLVKDVEEGKKEVKQYYTDDEYLSMPQEQFDEIMGTDPVKMTRHQLTLAMRRKNNSK